MSDLLRDKEGMDIEVLLRFGAEFTPETSAPDDLVARAMARHKPRFVLRLPMSLSLAVGGAVAAVAAVFALLPRTQPTSVQLVSNPGLPIVGPAPMRRSNAAPEQEPRNGGQRSVIQNAVQKDPIKAPVTLENRRRRPSYGSRPRTYMVRTGDGTPTWRTETVERTQEDVVTPGIVFEPNPDSTALVARPVVVSAPQDGGLRIQPVSFEHE